MAINPITNVKTLALIPKGFKYGHDIIPLDDGSWRWLYSCEADEGVVHFWVETKRGKGRPMLCGAEGHYRKDQGEGGYIYRENCDILDGPCWHSGSSLIAKEHLLPKFKAHDFMGIYVELVDIYKSWMRGERDGIK